jgi:hypothetical protein
MARNSDDSGITIGGEVFNALCFLYEESLRNNDIAIADVLENTIMEMIELTDTEYPPTDENELLGFSVLREFRKLSCEQQKQFLHFVQIQNVYLQSPPGTKMKPGEESFGERS